MFAAILSLTGALSWQSFVTTTRSAFFVRSKFRFREKKNIKSKKTINRTTSENCRKGTLITR